MMGKTKTLQSSPKRARKKIQTTTSKVRGVNQDVGLEPLPWKNRLQDWGWISQEKGQIQKHPTAAQALKGGTEDLQPFCFLKCSGGE